MSYQINLTFDFGTLIGLTLNGKLFIHPTMLGDVGGEDSSSSGESSESSSENSSNSVSWLSLKSKRRDCTKRRGSF
jgi:hypothetical protein